jgi:hypothetical protein
VDELVQYDALVPAGGPLQVHRLEPTYVHSDRRPAPYFQPGNHQNMKKSILNVL